MGAFVSVRSTTHGASLKTTLIGLLPIRGVDPLGWFFEQPLLNDVSTSDGSFLPINSHEEKMKKMVGFCDGDGSLLSMFTFLGFLCIIILIFFFAYLFCILIL